MAAKKRSGHAAPADTPTTTESPPVERAASTTPKRARTSARRALRAGGWVNRRDGRGWMPERKG